MYKSYQHILSTPRYMPWGKYKGRELRSIPRHYFKWLLNTWELDPDLEANITAAMDGTPYPLDLVVELWLTEKRSRCKARYEAPSVGDYWEQLNLDQKPHQSIIIEKKGA